MIQITNLQKSYGSVNAVKKISLTIPPGQICGYLGPNGAGKTTTVRMLTGMMPIDSGKAVIAGVDVSENPLLVKQQIGVVPESGALYQSLTPFEYLQFVGRLYHMGEKEIERRIRDFSDIFDMNSRLHNRMTTFSKGQKQQVVIIGALLHNPRVIFMDEPLNGLDANTALLLKELIRHLAGKGKTIFYCSHVLEVVENLCDRVVIINKGEIVADGSVDELKSMTKHSSLEGVFSQLTQDRDMAALAKVLSQKITETEWAI